MSVRPKVNFKNWTEDEVEKHKTEQKRVIRQRYYIKKRDEKKKKEEDDNESINVDDFGELLEYNTYLENELERERERSLKYREKARRYKSVYNDNNDNNDDDEYNNNTTSLRNDKRFYEPITYA